MRIERRAARALALAGCVLVGAVSGRVAAEEPSSGLPVRLEEITAPDFVRAVTDSAQTCLLPMGILEKHGPHLPLGTDLLNVRKLALEAASQEYAVVFPPYYVGQIFEARHQPGTIAYSAELMERMLQETVEELARNGFRRIVLVNGHGGNGSFVQYFAQKQLAQRRDYAVYVFSPGHDEAFEEELEALRDPVDDGHAGVSETSSMLANRPELVRVGRAREQSGQDLERLAHLPSVYTGIWWYAKFPNHYAGDGSGASRELGERLLEHEVAQLVEMIRTVKRDEATLELQNRFFDQAEKPLETVQ